MSSNNNRYDDEFKASAVKMVVEKCRSISAVAKDLGVSEPALRRWVKASTEPEDSASKRLAELEEENKRLKKELDDTKDTVEVLKKSVAIFIKPQK
ncbi:transposase [Alkaliphilus pronyensis]|uniref:Transposase n=1 Tax=Alkaliphilus pronyensis TaxID=1482732 RepID=A0A6I0EXF1_9FIRM|nr:transposase [Alkaliphilus pronyensis]KAB3531762.1 transposase [Alkaliphilus pronyensis]